MRHISCKVLRPVFVAVGALLLFGLPSMARADQIETFDLNGTFAQQADPAIIGNFSASIAIDSTTGLVVSGSLTDPYTTVTGSCTEDTDCVIPGPLGTNSYSPVVADAFGTANLFIQVDQTSLVGVTNLTLNAFGLAHPPSNDVFTTGVIGDPICGGFTCDITSATIVPAPEPNSLLLICAGTGLLLVIKRFLPHRSQLG